MSWLPVASVAVETSHDPPTSVQVPIGVVPSETATVPVALGAVTETVKLTVAPRSDGFADEVTAVRVSAGASCSMKTTWPMFTPEAAVTIDEAATEVAEATVRVAAAVVVWELAPPPVAWIWAASV